MLSYASIEYGPPINPCPPCGILLAPEPAPPPSPAAVPDPAAPPWLHHCQKLDWGQCTFCVEMCGRCVGEMWLLKITEQ